MSDWKKQAMHYVEIYALDWVVDDDDLREVYMDYCDPIKEVEKLQTKLAKTEKALEVAMAAIMFYGDKERFDGLRPRYCNKLEAVKDFEGGFGKTARQAEKEIEKILGGGSDE